MTSRWPTSASSASQDVRQGHRRRTTSTSTVADGEFIVLLGPSGCGKTTLLRCLAGLETVDAGRILIGERDVTDLPPRRAAHRDGLPELRRLPAHDGVRQHRLRAADAEGEQGDDQGARRLGRRARCTSRSCSTATRRRSRAASGSASRVARAIATKADVLLMDEPLSNLDALLRMEMRAELKALLRELGTTTIYVTHDQVEALSMGDRIAVMKAGHHRPGRHAARGLRPPGRHVRRRLRRHAADELPRRRGERERRRRRSCS